MNAQESSDKEYCAAIRKYLAAHGQDPCGEIAKELDVKLLTKVAKEVCNGVSGSQCKKLAVIYKEQMLEDDICRITLMPYFRKKNVTVEDMEKVMAAKSRPEYKELKQKTEQINKKIASVIIQNVISQSPVVAVDCPDSYRTAFHIFWEKTDCQTTLLSLFAGFKELHSTQSEKKIGELFEKHLEDNGEIEWRNAYYGTITEEELHIATDIEGMPENKRITAAVMDMIGSLISKRDIVNNTLAGLLQDNYENWLKSMTKK